ncbi:hypothetical protein GCM10027199_73180 [Amycolatopsis magusensis]
MTRWAIAGWRQNLRIDDGRDTDRGIARGQQALAIRLVKIGFTNEVLGYLNVELRCPNVYFDYPSVELAARTCNSRA